MEVRLSIKVGAAAMAIYIVGCAAASFIGMPVLAFMPGLASGVLIFSAIQLYNMGE